MNDTKKELTPLQQKANARNSLFRQIHGFILDLFICKAIKERAITVEELEHINIILKHLDFLKDNQFKGSKEVGLNPKRRCSCCKKVAKYKAVIWDKLWYFCDNHVVDVNDPLLDDVELEKINPYE